MMIRTWEIMQELMNLWKDEELVKEFIAEKDLSCCVGYVGGAMLSSILDP